MKNALVCAILMFVLAGSARFFAQNSDADRPPGVAAERWVGVNDRMGIVISDPTYRHVPGEPASVRAGIVEGQLWAKVGSAWMRVRLPAEQDGLRFLPAR